MCKAFPWFNGNVTQGVGKEMGATVEPAADVTTASYARAQRDAYKVGGVSRGTEVLFGNCEGICVVLHSHW